MRDYRRIVKLLDAEFPTQRLSEITSADLTRFIEKAGHVVGKRSRYIYLKAFIQFCAGKHNSHCNGSAWISPLILQWQSPKTEAKEVAVYRFDQIIELLKAAKSENVLPHFVFRLFSMMRTEEMKRFTEIHPTITGHPLISIASKRISITNQIFKKRSDNNHRGRFFNEVHPTFLAWLEHFNFTGESLHCTDETAQKIKVSLGIPVETRNLLRHTAITYHCIAFKNPLQTAYVAGNSVGIIQNHYLNMNVPESDALKLYELTPEKAKQLGIL